MLRWRYLLAYIVALICLAGFSIPTASFFSTIRSVDSPVEGLSEQLATGKTVHLVIVHGIGGHCIGYSNALTAGLARYLRLRLDDLKTVDDREYVENCPVVNELESGKHVGPKMALLESQEKFCERLNENCAKIESVDATVGSSELPTISRTRNVTKCQPYAYMKLSGIQYEMGKEHTCSM